MPSDPPSVPPVPARLQSEFMPRVWKSQRRKGAAEAVAVYVVSSQSGRQCWKVATLKYASWLNASYQERRSTIIEL